ncbi:hypothetical protein RND81_03G184400 [Saponaria officinalis]|uniref:Methyltransferase type 11 domain-containing protein n=1 Tax=Saponaria officinalis TaxID=3572 RepID=A0AAW1M197_SAPOF
MASITKVTPFIGRNYHRHRECRRICRPLFSFSAVRLSSPSRNLKVSCSSSSSSSVAIETTPEYISNVEEIRTDKNILGCPICYDSLTWSGDSSISIESTPAITLQCNTCKKSYYGKESYFDLTVASGSKDYVESMPPVTEFFSAPVMSFVYERGWRQNFGLGGYPGPDREFEMAKDYFRPVLGGTIVDASCGSGLFARRFAKSGLFSLVVALDYSGAMLRQCLEFAVEDPDFPKEKLTLVRADISRLPFVAGTIDAVHAGAALHCWPSPSAAVAEISRVLRPGGVFVATTTIADGPFALLPFRSTFREYLQQYSGSRVFLSERELRDLCTTCGLVDFRCTRNGLFVMISATKPC